MNFRNLFAYRSRLPSFYLPILFLFLSTLVAAQNPYDDYGKTHNTKLARFYDKTIGANKTQANDYIAAFKIEKFNGFGSDTTIVQVVEGKMSAKSYINKLNVNSAVKSELTTIANLINNSTNKSAFNSSIATFDTKIQSSKNFNSNEKALILIGSSIAKHSFTYWESNQDDWSLKGGPSVWRAVVGADFIGGVGRAIALGVLTGGVALGPVAAFAFAGSAATGLWIGANWVYDQVGKNTGWW